MYKSNATQSHKVTLFSLNFISPKSRSLHLMWLSGLLYDSGDNGESEGASRKWLICFISAIYLRRTWIIPWEHLFLFELDNQPRWRCLCYNCLRPSKTNPIEGTQANPTCTLAMAHTQKPLVVQLQQGQLRLSFWRWWLSFPTLPCRFQMQTPMNTNDHKIADLRRPSPLQRHSLPGILGLDPFQPAVKEGTSSTPSGNG